MRLTNKEVRGIIDTINKFVENNHAEIRLFGSRVDDNLKGGDIDLLLLLNQDSKVSLARRKHEILARMKEEIGDQRIDLRIATFEELDDDPFLQSIFPGSITLHITNFQTPT